MVIDFSGKTVVISGAGTGYGKVMAQQFAHLGARVFGADIRDDHFGALHEAGVEMAQVDLATRATAAQWIRTIEERTNVAPDVFINNVGGLAGQDPKPFDELDDADWDRVLEINVGSAFALCRAVVPSMKRAGRGAIITIGSPAALRASMSGLQAYTTAKHALLGFTRHLAMELGPFGIRVNSVAPGFLPTSPANERQWARMGEQGQQSYLAGIPLRRLGRAEELANVVAFMASDLASFVTGEMLLVDGGAK
ncbi:MAG TPA: SDR family NAD(P)-dependent oxidoreductase [Ramlibacter sp.]|nr:SDR family NAD(P)-dependent oxidoreductase [Ramlibacter sp.]